MIPSRAVRKLPRFIARLPGLSHLLELLAELDRTRAELIETRQRLDQTAGLLNETIAVRDELRAKLAACDVPWFRNEPSPDDSVDLEPWMHPYLRPENIAKFRAYSEQVWELALAHAEKRAEPLDVAFAVNMAQNMYKFAKLAQEAGARATLYLHPQDTYPVSMPQWEEYDGDWFPLSDGAGFLAKHASIPLAVPVQAVPMDDEGLLQAFHDFRRGDRAGIYAKLDPLSGVHYEPLLAYGGMYPYYRWARLLARHDVAFAASSPLAAYLCGRPYMSMMVGGDLQYDCGRGSAYGEIMALSFGAARFLMLSNPHGLGHSRRLGFRNGVYLPYPMDDHRYTPGEPKYRADWEAQCGPGVFILSASRIDNAVKGNGTAILDVLERVCRARPAARFVFLSWGADAENAKEQCRQRGIGDHVIFIKPAGKKRLIDYYRTCDIVLDQLTWGYYGTTALEAAAVGKPVVMRIRKEQYDALYANDTAPVDNVSSPEEIEGALLRLIDSAELRAEHGRAMREWLVRTHGAKRTVPLMMGLLALTADQVRLPDGLVNPLTEPLTDEERAYHEKCRVRRS